MCRDSTDTEWVYVIKSGSCRVLKSLNETKPNQLGLEHQIYSVDVKSSKGDKFLYSDFCVHNYMRTNNYELHSPKKTECSNSFTESSLSLRRRKGKKQPHTVGFLNLYNAMSPRSKQPSSLDDRSNSRGLPPITAYSRCNI